MTNLKYRLSFPNPLTHFIEISLEVDNITTDETELILPDWRPGRYELANYISNLKKIKAYGKSGKDLPLYKKEKNKWLVNTKGENSMRVEYSYYANKMDAGSSVLNEGQVYINFINCMLYLPNRMQEELTMEIDIPSTYRTACSLLRTHNTWTAKSYFELVDSPLLASEGLKQLTYTISSTVFNVFILGDCPIEDDTIIREFEKFSNSQIKQMGGFPSEQFDFIVQSLPYRHYHGVEHRNSTVLVLGPGIEDNKQQYFLDLMGVASHELFHAWNVTRIRPIELSPYDLSKENYYETGFVTEGFTTYYGDLFLARSSVFDHQQYIKELNTLLKRHFENYGRHNLSLTESSFDLWIDGYKKLLPSRKVSIYVKGAIAAFMLDIMIRKNSQNSKSLDDLIQDLWVDFGQIEKGYTKSDIYDLINKYGGDGAQHFIDKFYEGIVPIEDDLSQMVEYLGFKLVKKDHPEPSAALYGFRVELTNGQALITEIAPGSMAETYFSVGDKIVEINGKKIGEKGMEINEGENTFLLDREYKKKTITLNTGNTKYYNIYEIIKDTEASTTNSENFKLWIGQY
ncbi:MAG: PDZ domain-containing protein [Cyclobacteriaceae bacterium]